MAHRSRRGSTVMPLNPNQYGRRMFAAGRASNPPQSRDQGDLGAALAPQQSVLGQGPTSTLTPNVQAYAPEGGPGAAQAADQLSPLIAALMPPETAAETPAAPQSPAAPEAPTGGFPGFTPQPDDGLYQPEYGNQLTPPGNSPYPGFEGSLPTWQPSPDSIATYNQNKLIRLLMEGY